MRGKLKKDGKYELFETTRNHQILNLEDKNYYALVKGKKGDIIVHSNSDHEKRKTLSKGKFYFAEFKDDPAFSDMPHLFIEDGGKFRELILPEGFPSKSDTQKKLVRTKETLTKQKVLDHVKGKGNKGDEKQYEGKSENLREMTKKELYDLAQKKEIKGRSKMDKKDLIKSLSNN